jgi:hypothetical protein
MLNTVKIADINEFESLVSRHHEPLADKELNKAEKMAIQAIRAGAREMYSRGRAIDRYFATPKFQVGDHRPSGWGGRNIYVGASDTANGWTNGTEAIWINRNLLPLVKQGAEGSLKLASLLLHEYLHEEPSTGTHDHGVEFYERFHDLTMGIIHDENGNLMKTDLLIHTARTITETAIRLLEQDKKRGTRAMISLGDLDVRARNIGIGADEASPEDLKTPEAVEETVAQPTPEAPKEEKMAAMEGPSSKKKKPKERRKTTAVKKAASQLDLFGVQSAPGL